MISDGEVLCSLPIISRICAPPLDELASRSESLPPIELKWPSRDRPTGETRATKTDQSSRSQSSLSKFNPMRFEIERKSAKLTIRLPRSLLERVKAEARARGIPYTRYVRMVLEQAVD